MDNITSLKKKVFLCYSNSHAIYIDLLCKKLRKEGFQGIADGSELMTEKMTLSVQESIKKCDYFLLILSDEFGEHMQEEYSIALKYEMNILIFINSKLFRVEQINRTFNDRLVVLWENENELSVKIIEALVGFRHKYPERGYQFETLVEDLFKNYGCFTKKTSYTKDSNYDVYAEKDGKKYYIEAKTVRSKILSKQSIFSVMGLVDILELKSEEYFILVTANVVSEAMKEKVRAKSRFLIIDIGELLYLIQDNEELKYRLLSLIEYTTEDIDIKQPIEFLRALNIVEDEYLDNFKIDNDELKRLLVEVKDWDQDKRTSAEYEKFCTKALRALFSNDLALWREQQKSNDDLYRFDLICKIKDDVISAFWKFLEEYFRSKYVIFEFKNYKNIITQKEIYTTEKYLYAKALRCVAIIVSCNGADDNAKKAIKGTLRENGKLILNLSNRDLVNMLEYELNGNSASEYLYNILDDMLIELDK